MMSEIPMNQLFSHKLNVGGIHARTNRPARFVTGKVVLVILLPGEKGIAAVTSLFFSRKQVSFYKAETVKAYRN